MADRRPPERPPAPPAEAAAPTSPPPPVIPPYGWQAPAPSPWPRWLAIGYTAVAGLAASGAAVVSQYGGWLVAELGLLSLAPAHSGVLISVVASVLAAGFTVPVCFLRRWPALRAAGIAWTASAALFLLLAVLRLIPSDHHEEYLLLFAVLSGAAAWGWRRWDRRTAASRGGIWWGAAAGLAALIPWLWLGAAGGALETGVAAAAAAGFGALAGTVLGQPLWRPYGQMPRWKLVLAGGFAAGVALTLLTAGLGLPGAQLAALVSIPALGYAAAALQRAGTAPSGAPVGVMVAVAAFGPLGFTDPEEVSLLLEFWWPLVTGLLAMLIALGSGLGYGIALRPGYATLGAVFTAALTITGIAVYATAGQPGLHGERLFVVLESQASLTVPDSGEDRTARIAAVYRQLVSHAERTQAPLRRELDRWGLEYTPYYLVNGIVVHGGPIVREWLSRRADVDRVLLDPVLRPIPGDPMGIPVAGAQAPAQPGWNLDMVGAPRVWQEFGVTGEGIVVGVSDSGVDGDHPALREGFRGGADSWYDPWHHTRTPTDTNGHGTHTTAIAVGDRNVGVAPGAQWIGCVNLARNMASPSRYLDCLQFMLAPYAPGEDPFTDGDPSRAPHILNNSWGCPPVEGCDAQALAPAVAAFRAAGIFFAAAAGNTGPACGSLDDPPAIYPDAYAVTAVDEHGEVASFSSRGEANTEPRPDIAAPGVDVLSAMPDGGYARLAGTSMASPHVAGVVALLWSAVPELIGDIDATERLLAETAQPVSGGDACGSAASAGTGIVDAYAAIHAALANR